MTLNGPKWCSDCRDWWPRACFQRDRTGNDGLRSQCKACRAERRQALKAGAERRPIRGERRGITFKQELPCR